MSPWPSLIVSVAALCVSIWAITQSKRTSAYGHRLQERLLSLEASRERKRDAETKRATVVAFISGPTNGRHLYLRNEGAGTARNVKVTVDGQSASEHEYVLGDPPPSGILGTKAEYGMLLLCANSAPSSLKVEIDWEDDAGDSGHWESDLRFF